MRTMIERTKSLFIGPLRLAFERIVAKGNIGVHVWAALTYVRPKLEKSPMLTLAFGGP